MQAVQRIKREKRMDGGKEKEEVDDPHTSAAKQKRPLRIGAELLLAERPSCSCVAACVRHYFPRQGRRLEPRWRASREFHPPRFSRSCVQEYHCKLTGSWRSSLPKLHLTWVGIALHLLLAVLICGECSAQVVLAHPVLRSRRQQRYSSHRI